MHSFLCNHQALKLVRIRPNPAFLKCIDHRYPKPISPRRWKTTSLSAFQYVEQRHRDPAFEKLMENLKYLIKIVKLQMFLLGCPGRAFPLRPLARLQHKLRLRRTAVLFLRKFPHIFEVFKHPFEGYRCFRLTQKAVSLIAAEQKALKMNEAAVVERLQKLLMMSRTGSLPYRALLKTYRELGLPDDFEESILQKYAQHFALVRGDRPGDNDPIRLVTRNPNLAVAQIEKWRVAEMSRKGVQLDVADDESRYGFKLQFPPGFKLRKSYRDKLRTWQRLPYFSPYQEISSFRSRSKSGFKCLEKRAVAVLHEFLSLTVEKMIQVEQISHFRKSFGIELNIRDLFLDHPGIFYLSAKGGVHTVFLREAYYRGRLVEPNDVYFVRRKMLDLVVLGRKGMHLNAGFDSGNGELAFNSSGFLDDHCCSEKNLEKASDGISGFIAGDGSGDSWETCSDSEFEGDKKHYYFESDSSGWSDFD